MTTDELREACQTAGLEILYSAAENGAWCVYVPTSEGTLKRYSLKCPMLPAYVASRLLEKVEAAGKQWDIRIGLDTRYSATCWECVLSDVNTRRRVASVECLFIAPPEMAKRAGKHEQTVEEPPDAPFGGGKWHETLVWARGEEDDDCWCGMEEVVIRACMEVLRER